MCFAIFLCSLLCSVFCQFPSSVFTFLVDVTAVPSLIARIHLATVLGRASPTLLLYCANPVAGLEQILSWKRLFLYLGVNYVVSCGCAPASLVM